jgi:hypothetical protein
MVTVANFSSNGSAKGIVILQRYPISYRPRIYVGVAEEGGVNDWCWLICLSGR